MMDGTKGAGRIKGSGLRDNYDHVLNRNGYVGVERWHVCFGHVKGGVMGVP